MRRIKHQDKYYNEILDFCEEDIDEEAEYVEMPYPEHNDRYLKQCYYNLQEKYDRGIITKEEWQKIDEYYTREIMGYGN
jgi:3-methyladenine DNA glycosylase AlkD